jgi:hypothetical protein
MSTQNVESNEPEPNWFQIGQRVRLAHSGKTGVIELFLGGTLVAVKMDQGTDIDGIDHYSISWHGIERISDSDN